MGGIKYNEEHDDWEDEDTAVSDATVAFLKLMDEPTRVMSRDEINKQLAQAFPVDRPLELELDIDVEVEGE